MWWLYILECRNSSLYVGVTNDLERRFRDHSSGNGGHYTSQNRPDKILYTENFSLKSVAEARERQIKRWTKAKKLALIRGDIKLLASLSISRD